jgi:hypothetical protein
MRRSLPLQVLAWGLCGLPRPGVVAAAAVEYGLDFAASAGELSARVCLREPQSAIRFVLPERGATPHSVDARRDEDRPLVRDANVLRARDWRAGECLHYRVNLHGVAESGWRGASPDEGADLVLPTRAWLWRPVGLAGATDIEARVELPAGTGISVPWTPIDAAPHRHFRLDASDPTWPGMVALGRFVEHDIAVGSGGLRLSVTGAPAPTQQETIARNAREAAGDVLASFPTLLAARPQLLVVPVPGAREAVPFGQSLRGGGTGIMLYLNPRSTLAELRGSWTLTHELVHLAHPYLGDEGRWIAEGLATWYQNVLRARAGRISADEAWRHLAAGFARGIADPADQSLRETSRGGAGRHTMRLYWSGTALAMLGDIALRTRDPSPASLDLALSRFLDCCRAREVRLTPAQFLAALDREVGGDALERLYRGHADRSAFPEVAPAWHALGIGVRDDGTLRYDDTPAVAALRDAIMGTASKAP